jgi:endo-1,4-beta-xylanase
MLKPDRVREPEKYNMSQSVPGRINSIVNIHNPSIEVHKADAGNNTGTVIILAAGGGHRTLNVGGEAAAFIPFFYNYGVNCVILRNRLRSDGYEPRTDAVNDALQAIRMVRAYAREFNFDSNKIGIMGFSAGGELSAPASVLFDEFDKKLNNEADPFAGITSRPDFAVMIYTGPTPFARNRVAPPIPRNTPPAFLATPGSGDRVHAIWTMEYFSAMLAEAIPNIELHIYGNGVHGGSSSDRGGIPFGTWQYRFIDWFRDLGFLQKPGIETKAARDVAAYVSNPPRPAPSSRNPSPGPAPRNR